MSDNKKTFIAYIDEYDEKIEGWFKVILDNGIIIKFETGKNVITLPYNRVLKTKKSKEDSNEN